MTGGCLWIQCQILTTAHRVKHCCCLVFPLYIVLKTLVTIQEQVGVTKKEAIGKEDISTFIFENILRGFSVRSCSEMKREILQRNKAKEIPFWVFWGILWVYLNTNRCFLNHQGVSIVSHRQITAQVQFSQEIRLETPARSNISSVKKEVLTSRLADNYLMISRILAHTPITLYWGISKNRGCSRTGVVVSFIACMKRDSVVTASSRDEQQATEIWFVHHFLTLHPQKFQTCGLYTQRNSDSSDIARDSLSDIMQLPLESHQTLYYFYS